MWDSLPWFVQLAIEVAAIGFLVSCLMLVCMLIGLASAASKLGEKKPDDSIKQSDYGL